MLIIIYAENCMQDVEVSSKIQCQLMCSCCDNWSSPQVTNASDQSKSTNMSVSRLSHFETKVRNEAKLVQFNSISLELTHKYRLFTKKVLLRTEHQKCCPINSVHWTCFRKSHTCLSSPIDCTGQRSSNRHEIKWIVWRPRISISAAIH